jgi:hypothetical protein
MGIPVNETKIEYATKSLKHQTPPTEIRFYRITLEGFCALELWWQERNSSSAVTEDCLFF